MHHLNAAIRPVTSLANLLLVLKRTFVVFAFGLAASTLWAADDEARPRRSASDFQKRLLQEFDADKNGRLDKSEQANAKETMSKRRRGAGNQVMDRRELIKRFDKDGDGRLNEEERQVAMKARSAFSGRRPDGKKTGNGTPGGSALDRRELMKRFDKDGDGKISEEERAALRAAIAKRDTDRPDGARPGKAGSDKPRPFFDGSKAAPRRDGEMLKRFDKNGDGELDATERAAVRAAFAGRCAATDAAPAADKPDKGRVDKKALLDEFDADGDGKLTGDERAAARKAFEDRKVNNAKE